MSEYGRTEVARRPGGPRWPRRTTDRGAASGLIVGAAVAAAAVVMGGGVVVATQLSGGGPQPDDALPDSALAYVRVDLDPSASQKVNLIQLLRRFPDFEESTGISSDRDDLRRRLIESGLEESGCDVSYDDDIEPWIGDRAAVAALPGADGEPPTPVAVLQVTDDAAAEAGLAKLDGCDTSEGSVGGFAFTGDYVLLAESQETADAAVKEAEASPLSDDESYARDMDRLGDPGLASFWVDVPAVVDAVQATGEGLDSVELTSAELTRAQSVYGTFRAGDDNLELALLASGEQVLRDSDSPVDELPETTLFALSLSGLGDAVPGLWDKARELSEQAGPGAFDRGVADVEAESGLTLPEDLATLLGDNLTFGFDAQGLDPESLGDGEELPDVYAGVRITGDQEAIGDVLTKVQSNLDEQLAPFDLATLNVEGGVVVASNDSYATSMDDGGLSDTDAFDGAVGDTSSTTGVYFLNIDELTKIAQRFEEQQPDSAEGLAKLEPLQAVGVNVSTEDGYSQAVVKVTFD